MDFWPPDTAPGYATTPGPVRAADDNRPFEHEPIFEATMEAEHINTINARLADLSQRVVELRRYL
jgi:hypothetical protein